MSLLFYLNLDFFFFFFHFYSLLVQTKVKKSKIWKQQNWFTANASCFWLFIKPHHHDCNEVFNRFCGSFWNLWSSSAGGVEIADVRSLFFSDHLKWSLLCIKTQFQKSFFFSILGSWLSTRVPIHNALTRYAEALLSCCSNLFWGGMSSQKKLRWMPGWPLSVRT